jgi:hypothetical protein
MNNITKIYLVITVLACSIIYSFLFPKVKYVSPNILPQLKIPFEIAGCTGNDVSKNINKQELQYNFISDVFARVYSNPKGESLLFLILDAGNFHHPKTCFGSSGFKIKDLDDISIKTSTNKILKVHSMYVERGFESYLLIYWLCIDKNITEWSNQKFMELWYSLFNIKRTGLMVRFDIPVQNRNIEKATTFGKIFIDDLDKILSKEQNDYIFGK